MKAYIYTLVLITCFCSCSVAQTTIKVTEKEKNYNEMRGFMQNLIEGYRKYKILVNEKIIRNPDVQLYKKVENLFNSNQFLMIRNFNAKSVKEIIHFDSFFSKQDFTSMRNQLKRNTIKDWSEFIDSSYFLTEKKDSKQKQVSTSIPVFVKNNNFAIIYVEFYNSGDLRIFKKINEKWKNIAVGSVWTSD